MVQVKIKLAGFQLEVSRVSTHSDELYYKEPVSLCTTTTTTTHTHTHTHIYIYIYVCVYVYVCVCVYTD